MQVKLSRYKKVILSFLCVLTVAVSVCSFSFKSSAAVIDEYYLDYAEPTCSDKQGYISLALYKSTTGEIDIVTFFWTSMCYDSDGNEQPCMGYVYLNSAEVGFAPYVNSNYAKSGVMQVTRIDKNGVFIPYSPSTSVSNKVTYAFMWDNYQLIGYKYGGNAIVQQVSQSYNFALYFATDGSAQQLMQLYSLISSSQYLEQEQLNKLTSIINSNNSIDDKLLYIKDFARTIHNNLIDVKNELAELIEEEKKQTSWLEKIWESLQEFVGRKPDEEATAPADPEDNLGNMQESEEILLPDTSDAEESLDVELNSGFGVLTWLVDSFAKLDPGIFSTFLTMLTFGVIALILGR